MKLIYRYNKPQQSPITRTLNVRPQRFSMCDVFRNETEQNMGERSATSKPHMLYHSTIKTSSPIISIILTAIFRFLSLILNSYLAFTKSFFFSGTSEMQILNVLPL